MKRTGIAILLAVMVLAGCANSNSANEGITQDYQQLDITSKDAIAKMFPSLEGVLDSEWEQIKLGSGDDRTPGPSDYKYQGYIVLSEEAADKYASSYEWKEAEPDITFESIETRSGSWNYSYDFCKDIIPGYYGGEMWIDGNVILFSITTS
jgi:hypothetical protein